MARLEKVMGIDLGADRKNPADRLKRMYIIALGLIAILTILSQVVIRHALVRQESDAPVINIAGRQRMLSQKVAKAALALDDIADHCKKGISSPFAGCDRMEARLDELGQATDLWQRAHRGLQRGDTRLGLPGVNSPEVAALFEKADAYYQPMYEAARSLFVYIHDAGAGAPDEPARQQYIATILDHENGFLTSMNDIVSEYEAEARGRVVHLKRTGLTLMVIILVVLLAEVRLVFVPGARVIRRQFSQLRESAEWLSITLSSIGDAVIATDPGGAVKFMNPVAQALTGWKQDQAAGRPLADVFEIINEKTGKEAENPVKRVLREGVVLGLGNHTLLISKNGTRRAIDDSGAPIRDPAEHIIGAVLVFRDVTERRRADERLRKLSVAVQQSPGSVVMTNTEGTIEYVNPKFCEVTGYAPEEVIGRNPRMLKSGEMSPKVYKQMWDTIVGGEVWRGEFHNKRKNGELFWEFASISPIKDSEGVVTGFLSVGEDMTERKRAEEALQASEELLSTTLKSIGDAVMTTDAAGAVKFMNPVAQTLTGWKQDDAAGKPLTEIFAIVNEETGEQVENPVARVLREGVVVGLANHTILIAKDGTRRPIDDSGAPIRDRARRIVGTVLVFRDITERRQVEEELSRYRHHLEELVAERTKQLEASQEQLRLAERLASIGTLAAGIAHEINNPVGAILLTAQNASEMNEESDTEAAIAQALDKIIDNAKRCGHIVESILQFSRQETTRKWPNDLNAAIQHAVEVTRNYAKEWGVVIGLEPARDLPKVVFNPIEIEQVFVNLIRNAIEAGGPNLRVSIRSEKTPGGARVVTQDNGRGLTEEERIRVFDPFYTTRQEQGGTGLGLSITHGIVSEHGGKINIQSRTGEGTMITVTLPFEVAS